MHPLVKILLFIFILLLMSYISDFFLWMTCTFLCVDALLLDFVGFLKTLRRLKWLLVSIFLVYGLSTPGEYVPHMPEIIALTKEGCFYGLAQISRLLIAVATLSILFATSTITQLMSGLHMLLSPLSLFGLDTNRFTARLMLTLDYVEEFVANEKFKFSFDQLDNMLAGTNLSHKERLITLENLPFKWTDKLILLILLSSAFTLLYYRVFNLKAWI